MVPRRSGAAVRRGQTAAIVGGAHVASSGTGHDRRSAGGGCLRLLDEPASITNSGGGEVEFFVVVAFFRGVAGGFRRGDASLFSLEFRVGFEPIRQGIMAGLPMVTWPVFAEQFSNEKFVVNVIKTGIRVGVEVPVMFGEEEKVEVQVKSDEIKTVIGKLMDGGDEEGEERIERARKLGKMAKSALDEGGSSYLNLTRLIQDVVVAKKARFGCQSGNGEKLES
ncbi:hypothetical protein CASFOL_013449 [Castilleja foliolosa]|uniref:Uncharacterized protein n=1 Tax=Castilleja foliolosa TaxID=1961234 RepID=A0ABD3DNM2_9LAMI